MTERVLPAIAIPVPAGHGPRPASDRSSPDRAADRPVARTAGRTAPFLTTPARAAMLLGGSAAVYALTLAGVAALQHASDVETMARRQPWLDQVAQTRAANDALEAALLGADGRARELASEYDAAGGDIAAYQARLDELAALVAQVEGSAAALPARISLPTVTARGPIASGSGRSAPATTTRSGASGG